MAVGRERLKLKFGEEGNIFSQSELAAEKAKHVRVGKLHLLCLVLFILCLLREANSCVDIIHSHRHAWERETESSKKPSLVISCACTKPLHTLGQAVGPAVPMRINPKGTCVPCVSASQHCWQGNKINLLFASELCSYGCSCYLWIHTMAIKGLKFFIVKG